MKANNKPPEPVSSACSYTSDQLCFHAQISKLVLRAAVRAGLAYIKIGGARHFLGEDWIAWMKQHRGKSVRTTEGILRGQNRGPTDAVASILGQPQSGHAVSGG